ncbi:hypothetical protein MTO96_023892 [Rhipicephalus appendiculatus]
MTPILPRPSSSSSSQSQGLRGGDRAAAESEPASAYDMASRFEMRPALRPQNIAVVRAAEESSAAPAAEDTQRVDSSG